MTFKELSKYLQKLEDTSSRLEITQILSDLFKKTHEEEIGWVVYLILGTLGPSYKNIIFNVADKMMEQAISQAYGVSKARVHELYKQKGDLGEVAYALNQNISSFLTVEEVYLKFVKVADYEGQGSQDEKIEGMAELLKGLDKQSSKFASRIPVGKLRLGFSEKTIIDALSWMEKGDKSGKTTLEKAFIVLPDVGLLAKEVKRLGIEKASKNIEPQVGIPIQPMLAQRIKSPTEMIKKMGKVAVEPKLDGLRVLVHFKRGKNGFVKAFTRNMNEVGWMFPELGGVEKQLEGNEFILDTEAVGMDESRKRMADFQTTMQRRRKHEVDDFKSRIPITFYAFDVLKIDGRNLLSEDYLSRRKALKNAVKKGEVIKVVESSLTDNPQTISELQSAAINDGLEGVMVKRIDSPYVPGRTGWRWVKMKEAELATGKLSDTVDAVVMGYTQGKGKRASFGIGQFLVGVIDQPTGKIKTVSKVGTGLSDDDFKELSKRLKKIQVRQKPKEYDVHKNLMPDYWVEPRVVVELAADDLTRSPNHTAGYALRFPRLVKFRDDKSPDNTTSVKEIQRLYKLQYE